MELIPAFTTAPARPTPVRAFLLRFGLIYAALFMIPIVAGSPYGFRWAGALIGSAIESFVGWVARDILGISRKLVSGGGSGDTTLAWIWLLCCVVIASLAATAWLAIDRKRAHDAKLRAALRIF